jgi:hypothetical protein
MAELDKNKSEPQKQASSAFKGASLPKNNSDQETSGTPKSAHTPKGSPKPAPTGGQIPKSSIISKLNQPENLSDKAEQNQTANVVPKSTSTKQTPQNSLINKLPQRSGPLKQSEPSVMSKEESFLENSSGGFWQQVKGKLFVPKPGVSPTRQKAMVIMVPILAIVMIFAFRQVLSKAPRQTDGAETNDASVVAHADTGHEIDWEIPEPINIIPRDPIQLPDEDDAQNPEQGEQNETTDGIETATGAIIIRDIVYSKDKPSAVIGSKIVYIGDVINGVTIINIDRDSIEFEKNGERWEQNVRDGKKIPILEENTKQSEGRSEPIE